jgi:APA family basic amino acid/polyamine antiporter
MSNALFQTKSLEQLKANVDCAEHQLKKDLGTFDLTMFGIGAIIGAGIFSTIGTAAAGSMNPFRPGAGPALIISFICVAIACGFTALCYAELAAMIPVSGSAYTYAYATLGELMAWIIGWDLVLEYAVSNVAVAISWGGYARRVFDFIGIHVPAWLAVDPRSATYLDTDWMAANKLGDTQPAFVTRLNFVQQAKDHLIDGSKAFPNWDALSTCHYIGHFPLTTNLLAILITIAITWLCYIGVRESARANSIMVVIKLIILCLVIMVGVQYINGANYHPFIPNGWAGIQAGAAIIFFAFIGFDAVSTTAEECQDPGKNLPQGIILSLVICTFLYILVTLVATGMAPWKSLGTAEPLADIFKAHGRDGWAVLISVGAMIAIAACLLVYQVGQPRIMMAMSRDGLLGKWFGEVHPKYGTPANATMLTGFIVAIPAAFMSIDEVVDLCNIGTLFAFIIACSGVMILRVQRPDAPRKFVAPAIWVTGPLGIISCIWLAYGLPGVTWIRFFIWLFIGLIIYFIYGTRNSQLRRAQQQGVND